MEVNGPLLRAIIMAEQLPADSSGLVGTTSPSGSSDSSSSYIENKEVTFVQPRSVYRSPVMAASGKNMNLMAKVQKPNRRDHTPVPGDTTNLPQEKLTSGESEKTEMFLSQFQAQMSQVKSALDAAESEIHLKQKPIPIGKSPKGQRRRAKDQNPARSPRGRPRGSRKAEFAVGSGYNDCDDDGGVITYQSQISASNGLKLKIRKSPGKGKRAAPSRGQKKPRAKKRKYEDDDLSDTEIDNKYKPKVPSSARSAKSSQEVVCLGDNDLSADGAPSEWGTKLPEELLFKVLNCVVETEGCIPSLIRASKVSRLWRKVCMMPELWTNIDLTSSRIKDVYRSERNLAHLLDQRFTKVQHLNLGGWSSAVTNVTVDILARNCKSLQSLNLSSCQKLTGYNLKTIVDSCPLLSKLDLSFISTAYNTKSAVSPIALGEAAEAVGSRLTFLSLANNCLANCPQLITSLSEHCPNLESLDLSNVTSPRRDTIIIRIESLQQGCPNMRVLRFTNTEIALSETSLKDQAASPGFPKLEELSIAVDPKRYAGMDDGDLERILKASTKLRLLDVRGCTKISDSGLVRIPAWDLENLYVSGCFTTKSTKDGLELVVRKWRHSFREIDFSWMPNEEAINLAVTALAETEDPESIIPLRKLDLLGSSVSFASVKAVLTKCTNLISLNLTSCRALPRGIKRNYPNPWDVTTLRDQTMSGKFDENANN